MRRRKLLAAAGVVLAAALALAGCGRCRARSEKSFDEIHELVSGKTSGEVVRLLGEPDSRQPVFGSDQKWIWWDYTFLDGGDHPPEIRGRVVHLEIVFRNPERSDDHRWRVDGSLAVNYRMPSSDG